jgi:hypothetical protein
MYSGAMLKNELISDWRLWVYLMLRYLRPLFYGVGVGVEVAKVTLPNELNV